MRLPPGAELAVDRQLVIWPPNEQLIARANGMSPETLRRRLAKLESGLFIRDYTPTATPVSLSVGILKVAQL